MLGKPLVTFRIQANYATALRTVRRALEQQGLRVPTELDVSARIKQDMGAGVAPCVVLYVDDPALLLESVVFHRGAALLIPQPLVLSGANHHTDVFLRSSESLLEGGLPASVREPLLTLHARMVRAVETVAEREGAHLLVNG